MWQYYIYFLTVAINYNNVTTQCNNCSTDPCVLFVQFSFSIFTRSLQVDAAFFFSASNNENISHDRLKKKKIYILPVI